MTREHVIDRIAKLLALAEGAGASPNEAATAAATAQRLMEQHNIDRAELADDEESVRDDHDPIYTHEGKLPSWLGALADVVTRANACRIWIRTLHFEGAGGVVGRRNQLAVVGRKSDVQVCRYLFAFGRREIERLVELYRARGLIRGRTQITNFRSGCVAAFRDQLRETQRAARVEASSTAIVRLDQRDQDAQDAIDQMGMRKQIINNTPDLRSWALGHKAGSSIQIRPGVDGKDAPKRLT